MKTHTCMKMLGVVCTASLASCTTTPLTTTVPMSSSARPDSSLSGSIHQKVNEYRRSHGATALPRHPGLDRLAQQHCEFLRQNRGKFGLSGLNVSHYGFEGRSLAARERYQIPNLGENVAASKADTSTAAPTLVNLWANSRNHEYTMRSSWTYTGVGAVIDDDGTVFSTQLFGSPVSSQMALTDRFRQF